MPDLSLTLLEPPYSVCRLAPSEHQIGPVPGAFSWLVAAPDEVTLVCPTDRVPERAEAEHGWRCLRIDQVFAFGVPGILASVLQPLAAARIGIFATSMFSTDYVLVKADHLDAAIEVLEHAGHRIERF
jgi:uncharacterized protein